MYVLCENGILIVLSECGGDDKTTVQNLYF